jgi:hypothetical protein
MTKHSISRFGGVNVDTTPRRLVDSRYGKPTGELSDGRNTVQGRGAIQKREGYLVGEQLEISGTPYFPMVLIDGTLSLDEGEPTENIAIWQPPTGEADPSMFYVGDIWFTPNFRTVPDGADYSLAVSMVGTMADPADALEIQFTVLDEGGNTAVFAGNWIRVRAFLNDERIRCKVGDEDFDRQHFYKIVSLGGGAYGVNENFEFEGLSTSDIVVVEGQIFAYEPEISGSDSTVVLDPLGDIQIAGFADDYFTYGTDNAWPSWGGSGYAEWDSVIAYNGSLSYWRVEANYDTDSETLKIGKWTTHVVESPAGTFTLTIRTERVGDGFGQDLWVGTRTGSNAAGTYSYSSGLQSDRTTITMEYV